MGAAAGRPRRVLRQAELLTARRAARARQVRRAGGSRLQGPDAVDARGAELSGGVRTHGADPGSPDVDDRRHARVDPRAGGGGRLHAAHRGSKPRHAARRERRVAGARVRRALRPRRTAKRDRPPAADRRVDPGVRRRGRGARARGVEHARSRRPAAEGHASRGRDPRGRDGRARRARGGAPRVAPLCDRARVDEGTARVRHAPSRRCVHRIAADTAHARRDGVGGDRARARPHDRRGVDAAHALALAARRSRHRRRSHPHAAAAADVERLQGGGRRHRVLRPGAGADRRRPGRERGRRDSASAVQRHQLG